MDSITGNTPSLQFETAVPATSSAEADATEHRVTCAACQHAIVAEYFDVNGQPVCDGCRGHLTEQAETPRGWDVLTRAGVFGFGAAIVGALVYYAVIALTNFEIGLVAILIGYMVGYAVRAGARGRGGKRFQILAVVLTYWAVGLAYMPLAFQGVAKQQAEAPQQANASASPDTAATEPPDGGSFAMAVAVLLGLSFAMPVLSVFSSLPSGLISAAIIAFGMQQAWRMTAAPQLQISGPYRIGPAPQALV
jgi:hypothetical protein